MNTKERILNRTIDLFNQQGMYRTGVRDIARSLDISPGNLSYHFPRKEDLLIALLGQYGTENDRIYAAYQQGDPALDRYLETISRLLANAYNYRGIFLGLDEVRTLFGKEFNYAGVENKRRTFLSQLLGDLEHAGDLDFSVLDKSFMIDFLAFFQRCWIMEAMISYSHMEQDQIIGRYMRFVAIQFAQIATLKGQQALGIWL